MNPGGLGRVVPRITIRVRAASRRMNHDCEERANRGAVYRMRRGACGSTFVRSRSKFGRRGSQGSIVATPLASRLRARTERPGALLRNPYYLAFTAILSCITPSLSVSTALVASTHLRHTGRVTCHRGSPAGGHLACGRRPAAGSRKQNGAVYELGTVPFS